MQSPPILSELDLALLVYALYLIASARPIMMLKYSKSGYRWPDIKSFWFRVAGGVYLIAVAASYLFPGLPEEAYIVTRIIAGIFYVLGIGHALMRPVF